MAEAAAYVVAAGNAHTNTVAETAAEMADTYDAVVETHAVIDDAPPMPWPKPWPNSWWRP